MLFLYEKFEVRISIKIKMSRDNSKFTSLTLSTLSKNPSKQNGDSYESHHSLSRQLY